MGPTLTLLHQGDWAGAGLPLAGGAGAPGAGGDEGEGKFDCEEALGGGGITSPGANRGCHPWGGAASGGILSGATGPAGAFTSAASGFSCS
jgi:hypothetical protein